MVLHVSCVKLTREFLQNFTMIGAGIQELVIHLKEGGEV